jgi:hypothetical protein
VAAERHREVPGAWARARASTCGRVWGSPLFLRDTSTVARGAISKSWGGEGRNRNAGTRKYLGNQESTAWASLPLVYPIVAELILLEDASLDLYPVALICKPCPHLLQPGAEALNWSTSRFHRNIEERANTTGGSPQLRAPRPLITFHARRNS